MTEFCIFDLDGTLLDTLEDLAVSVNYALEKNGLPQHPIDSYRYFVGDGVLTLIRRASGSGDEGLVKALKADFDRYYNVHRFDRTRPYDGARELLEALAKRNIPAAVLSNKPDEFVGDLMKRYFPGIFFFAAVGKRPGVAKKPDPAALNQLIAQKGAEKPACLYVGDSNVDVETAHNAGIRCCGAEWGFRGYRELKEAGADCFAKVPLDVLAAL